MDSVGLLHEARRVGLVVAKKDTKLVVRGPRSQEQTALLLLRNKQDVLLALEQEHRDDYVRWLTALPLAERIAHDRAFGRAWFAGHPRRECEELARQAVEDGGESRSSDGASAKCTVFQVFSIDFDDGSDNHSTKAAGGSRCC